MIEDILYENSAVNMYSMIGGGGNFGGSNFGGGRGPKLSSLGGLDFGPSSSLDYIRIAEEKKIEDRREMEEQMLQISLNSIKPMSYNPPSTIGSARSSSDLSPGVLDYLKELNPISSRLGSGRNLTIRDFPASGFQLHIHEGDGGSASLVSYDRKFRHNLKSDTAAEIDLYLENLGRGKIRR